MKGFDIELMEEQASSVGQDVTGLTFVVLSVFNSKCVYPSLV